MTLHAYRQSEHRNAPVVVSATSGAIEVKVTEDIGHARYFWHQLGGLLDHAERERHMADHEDRIAELERRTPETGGMTRDEKAAEVAGFLCGDREIPRHA